MQNHEFLYPAFGCMGAMAAIVLPVIGAAYGTARCMIGVASVAPKRPQLIMKSMVPMIMAGVLGIYGLVSGVLILNSIEAPPNYNGDRAFLALGAGLAVGLSSLVAGFAIGNVGEVGIRSAALQSSMFTTVVLVTGFAMVAGMYGLVVGLVQVAKK